MKKNDKKSKATFNFHFPICSIIFPYQGILSKKNPTKKVVV